MKKKVLISIVLVVVVLVLGIIGYMFYSNQEVSVVTLEINPNIELHLTRREKVKSVVALNDDAKEIISDSLKGMSLKESLKEITAKVVEKGYAEEGSVTVLLTSTGAVDLRDVEKVVHDVFVEKQVQPEVIVIESITEEDKKLAEEYHVSPAKAALINSILKEQEELNVEAIIDKPIKEINETKMTGNYCDEGYSLEGDFCLKEKERVEATNDSVCPKETVEVKGVCYKTYDTEEEQYCKNGLELKNGKCVGTEKVDAKASCSTGTYNSKTGKCEELTYVSDAKLSCPNSEQKLLSNGRCASPHMGAHFDDPDGVIDPATECCCGDTWYPDSSAPGRGWCYSPAGNDDAVATCASGQTVKDGKCYKAETSDAIYICTNGKLDGTKCVVDVSKNADTKLSCKNGLTLYEDRICYNNSETVEKQSGYSCKQENSKLVNNMCVIYDIVEAHHANQGE